MKQGLLSLSVLSVIGFLPNSALADVTCVSPNTRTATEKFILDEKNPASVNAFYTVSFFEDAKTHTTTQTFTGQLEEAESSEAFDTTVKTYSLVNLVGETSTFVLTSTTDWFGGGCGRGSCRAPTKPITVTKGTLTLATATPSNSVKNFSCYVN